MENNLQVNWKEIDTDSLWLFDKSEGYDKSFYGAFIPQISDRLISRYTKEGDLVVDWFMGSGTSAYSAIKLNRNFIGTDIDCERLSILRKDLDSLSVRLFCNDSSELETSFLIKRRSVYFFNRDDHDLSILHPPYFDIIKFTDNIGDLSLCQSTDKFLMLFSQVAHNSFLTLKEKGFGALIIGDIYKDSQLVPLGFYCMQRMMTVGFKLKSIIVKNIAGNERGKGKNGNLWKYRAVKGNFSNFKHEYIMVFQK